MSAAAALGGLVGRPESQNSVGLGKLAMLFPQACRICSQL